MTQIAVSTDGSDVLPTAKWTTQEELNAFKQAITAAEAVLNKAGVTQAEVNQAVLDLGKAVTTYTNAQKAGTKIVSGEVDRTALSTKIGDAQAVKVVVSENGSDVLPTAKWTTQEALNTFNQAIAAAEAVLNNTGATQAEVNQAILNLDNAVTTYTNAQKAGTKIVSGEVDRTALSTKIGDAQAVKVVVSENGSDVLPTAKWTTQEALNTFNQAIAAAEAVLIHTGATQAEVDQAILNIDNAVTTYTNAQKDGTKEDSGGTVDTTALSTKIGDAQAVKVVVSENGSDVLPTAKWTTQEALNTFNQAIAAAEAVLIDTGATQAEVDQAILNIDNAVTTYTNAQKDGTKNDSQWHSR